MKAKIEAGLKNYIRQSNLTWREFQRVIIETYLEVHNQNRTHTAKALGMAPRTMRLKISQYKKEKKKESTNESEIQQSQGPTDNTAIFDVFGD